jgi:hypothetical protein
MVWQVSAPDQAAVAVSVARTERLARAERPPLTVGPEADSTTTRTRRTVDSRDDDDSRRRTERDCQGGDLRRAQIDQR